MTALVVSAVTLAAQSRSAFEVASIRPSPVDGSPASAGVRITERQFQASFLSLMDYIGIAYGIPIHRIVAPDWLAGSRFEIAAVIPEGAAQGQLAEMVKELLATRFLMRTHNESREFPVYVLEVAEGGMKLTRVPEEPPAGGAFTVASMGTLNGVAVDLGNGSTFTFLENRFEAKRVTMDTLAATLSRFVDRPVQDLTKMDGRYDIAFTVPAEDFRPMLMRSAVNAGATLAPQALRLLENSSVVSVVDGLAALGLRLNARRMPLDVLVIDSIERTPTPN